MRRALLISLALVLALVGGSAVCAEDGFYVIPTMKGNYAPVPKTGQTVSNYPRDDGAFQKGMAWPTPRFTDNNNGTVTDNLTGLIWQKNANAFQIVPTGLTQALLDAQGLANGIAGLTDGSKAGDWRLPNIDELMSLNAYTKKNPSLPAGHPFINVQATGYPVGAWYWTTTTSPQSGPGPNPWVWVVNFTNSATSYSYYGDFNYVWCVRGGP